MGVTDSAALSQGRELRCGNSLRYRGNFRLNGAQQHLSQAEGTQFAPDRQRRVSEALRVLAEATQAGGTDEATLWFLYAKAYLLDGDLVGADSALARTARAAAADADCVREIGRLRFNAAVPLFNAGVEQMRAERLDSALILLRRGLLIHRESPIGYMNVASVFNQREMPESAAVYFRLASRAGTEPQQNEMRQQAAFNSGRLYERAGRLAAAESMYVLYVALNPRDVDAKISLAGVVRRQGRGEQATAMLDSLVARPDDVNPFDLFAIGAALYREQDWARAARAIEAGLRRNPLFRDAVYNLTSTYLSAGDTARFTAAARRLTEVDPNSRQSWRLLAQAYQWRLMELQNRGRRAQAVLDSMRARRQPLPPAWQDSITRLRPQLLAWQDSVVRTLARADSIPWEIQVQRFERRDSTAGLRGAIINVQGRERPGFTLVLEFLGPANDVLATERVEIPALNAAGSPGSAYDFSLQVRAAGIQAYRYRPN